jgi:hypothetical protein
MAAQNDLPDISIDSKGLYREDVFTDRRAGSIRRLTPVTVEYSSPAVNGVSRPGAGSRRSVRLSGLRSTGRSG